MSVWFAPSCTPTSDRGSPTTLRRKGKQAESGKGFGANPPGAPPIVSLVAWGRLLNQLNFASLIGPVTGQAGWSVKRVRGIYIAPGLHMVGAQ